MAETATALIARYTEVRQRLRNVPPPPPDRQVGRVVPIRPQSHRPDYVLRQPPLPMIIEPPMSPRERDWIVLRKRPGAVVFKNWRKIIREVCAKHAVSMNDVLSDYRAVHVVAARFECYWRLRTELKMSFPTIGKAMGGRDHSSVVHGVRKYEARMEAVGQ